MINLLGITKKFNVYRSNRDRLREWLYLGHKHFHTEHWALKNISLSIPKGEVFGLVGMNGAGKSTLLKIITGTMSPSGGSIELKGRVAALLELGTGFHHELTGRENVEINGRVLGLSSSEISERMKEIEAFAELNDYFDKPLRTYSTGMHVRLAFALATSVHPDILIIDEALSVGDAYFQQKCISRMQEFKERGTTILFVSHDLGILKFFCDRVALLENGQISATGKARDILEIYNTRLADHSYRQARLQAQDGGMPSPTFKKIKHEKAEILNVEILNENNQSISTFESGSQCRVSIKAKISQQLDDPTVGFLIRDRLGYDIFGTNTRQLLHNTGHFEPGEKVDFKFSCTMNIGPGEYTLTVALHQDSTHIGECHQWIDRALSFKVLPRSDFQFIGVSLIPTKFSIDYLSTLDSKE